MVRPVNDVVVVLKVEYVLVPEDRIEDWRAGISLLLQLLKEERKVYEAEVSHAGRAYAWVLGHGTVHRIRLVDWSVHYARSMHG